MSRQLALPIKEKTTVVLGQKHRRAWSILRLYGNAEESGGTSETA